MYCHVGIQSGKTCLAKLFSTNLRVQRQKNGLESKFGTSSSRNPNSDVSIRVVDESPHLLVGQTCTTWSHFSLHVGFYCWPYQAAFLVATLGTYPPCSLVNPPCSVKSICHMVDFACFNFHILLLEGICKSSFSHHARIDDHLGCAPQYFPMQCPKSVWIMIATPKR